MRRVIQRVARFERLEKPSSEFSYQDLPVSDSSTPLAPAPRWFPG
jgi:hypothetical protein